MLVTPSVKLGVAICHIDFTIDALTVRFDLELQEKVQGVDEALRGLSEPPHLLAFPEGVNCPELQGFAEKWAVELGITTICGSTLQADHVIGTVVAPSSNGASVTRFGKAHLSPYDSLLAGRALISHSQPGIEIELQCRSSNGATVPVNVLVLICYDFRFEFYRAHREHRWRPFRVARSPRARRCARAARDARAPAAKTTRSCTRWTRRCPPPRRTGRIRRR